MRIAHLTDIHVQTTPRLTELFGKRLLSTANLYLMGRRRSFSRASAEAAVAAVCAEEPDVVVISGDVTAQALDAEFEMARRLLDPLLQKFPTVVIAGNHDTYIPEGRPGDRMRRYFGDVMGESSPALHVHGEVAFLAMETCRSHITSSGRLQEGHVAEAARLLADGGDHFTFLLIHYPLRGRDGTPYGPGSRALVNAGEIEAMLASTDLIGAVLHGHEHHGFRVTIPSGRGDIPILNPGASGWSFQPDRDRTAHFNIYEADRAGLHEVTRFKLGADGFRPEPGGPYAQGR
jgi:3',5'-cyclic AMP phosphodiesterase CpdA